MTKGNNYSYSRLLQKPNAFDTCKAEILELNRESAYSVVNGKIAAINCKDLSTPMRELSCKIIENGLEENHSVGMKCSEDQIDLETLMLTTYNVKELLSNVRKHSSELCKQTAVVISEYLSKYFDPQGMLMPIDEHFRILPPSKLGFTGVSLHRDTWLGFPNKGINLWIPITDTPSATLKLYPKCLNKKLVLENRGHLDMVPAESEDLGNAIVPFIDYGQALLFSSRHLHCSAENLSSRNRISWDYRLIFVDDFAPCRRSGEFAFLDLINENPTNPEAALHKTRERIRKKRKYFLLCSYSLTSLKKQRSLLNLAFKLAIRVFAPFRFLYFR